MGLPWRWRSTSKELAPSSAQTSATLRPILRPVVSSHLPLARINSFASYHMLQLVHFHPITHSFAPRRKDYSLVFSDLRTLYIVIGGGGHRLQIARTKTKRA